MPSAADPEAHRAEYRRRRWRQYGLLLPCLVVGVPVRVMAESGPVPGWACVACAAALAVAALGSYWNWRCPACGASLPFTRREYPRCLGCGARFD